MAKNELVAATALEVQVQEENAKRSILAKYVKDNMQAGTDFYTLRIGARETKPSLSKSGSEKILSLFHWRSEFTKDSETWEMLGSPSGVLCYICKLYTIKDGALVGEGRGARDVKKDNGDANKALKMAQKSAQIDAVLRTGGLSDVFTQDLEDATESPTQADSTRMTPYQVPRRVPAEDDEPQGKRYDYPKMDESNDAHPLADLDKPEPPKNTAIILQLLTELGKPATTPRLAKMNIKMLTGGLKTGLSWELDKNDEDIIEALRKLLVTKMNNGKE